MSDISRHWKEFYSAEIQFFHFILNYGKVLKSEPNCEPIYLKVEENGKTLSVPPKNIRCIIDLEEDYWQDVNNYIDDLQDLYRNAMQLSDSPFKRYPTRFPVVCRNLSQINIYRQTAVSSKLITQNQKVPISRFFVDSESRLLAKQAQEYLELKGFNSVSLVTGNLELQTGAIEPAIYLCIEATEIFNFFGTNEIRMRRVSGTQYRAMCYSKDPDADSIRSRYGLILCSGNPTIFETVPQRPRSHKTESTQNKLSFGSLPGQFIDLYEPI